MVTIKKTEVDRNNLSDLSSWLDSYKTGLNTRIAEYNAANQLDSVKLNAEYSAYRINLSMNTAIAQTNALATARGVVVGVGSEAAINAETSRRGRIDLTMLGIDTQKKTEAISMGLRTSKILTMIDEKQKNLSRQIKMKTIAENV